MTESSDRGEAGIGDVEIARNRFGTFGGVFTPTILTIFGVIMFMRAGYVTGQAGVLATIGILFIAKLITLLTGLSIAAISTNARVKGGGAYFLISRTLGPEFGGAIGLTLYLAQALSVPFYVLGFVESVVLTFPGLQPWFGFLCVATATLLFVITYVGAGWAMRVQYVVLAVLATGILVFLAGAALQFEPARLAENWSPAYTSPKIGFWVVFAIYFPAATGIMAGVNMSGDLADPARAIPRGTLAAIAVGFVFYLAQAILTAGAQTRDELVNAPFSTLVDQAALGLGFVVVAGVFAATLSSGLGSLLGAPRILQALARDEIFRPLRHFAKGTERGDEPRRSLWLTYGLTLVVLVFASSDPEGGAFNVVAAVLTMFFLYTYGMTNLAAFVESITHNPSFRPRFRAFHWSTALLGAIGCVAAAVLIDPIAAAVAVAIIVAIFVYVRSRVFRTTFGDTRRGFFFARVRQNLSRLAAQPSHPKNWRPTTLVFTGNPHSRLTLTTYAMWLGSVRGLVTLAEILVGRFEERVAERESSLARLRSFIEEHALTAYPEVLVAEGFDQGLRNFIQVHSVGPLKPNLVVLGWPTDSKRAGPLSRSLRIAHSLRMSTIVAVDRGLPPPGGRHRIDIWWRGLENGSLMLILAYLLTLNWEWDEARIRVLRMVRDEAEQEEAELELRTLVEAARIGATTHVLRSDRPFPAVLHEESQGAAVVLLGYQPPDAPGADRFHRTFSELLEELPTTLLVSSSGEADLLA